ncbi:hypothetical protein [Thalassospira tepidiphila]|uniref:hypothetical protein n=1 Tax=Thalassospira tepidiphila TaxID=393657 RepID=UPI0030C6DDB6
MLDICGSSFVRGWVKSRGSVRFSVFSNVRVSLALSDAASEAEVIVPESLSDASSRDVSDEVALLSTVLLAFFFPNMG